MLLVVCDNAANGLLIMLRSPTKLVTNIPPGVGADSSRPYPCITKYTYSHNQICVFKSPHMHFRPPFRGCIRIRGHDKSVPYGCLWFAVMLLTDCDNATNTHETPNEYPRNAQQTLSIWWVNNSLQTCCCVMFVCLQVL